MRVDAALSYASIVTGFVAAIFWGVSASVNVPTNLEPMFLGPMQGLTEMQAGMIKAAWWNQFAAGLTAISVALQAAALAAKRG